MVLLSGSERDTLERQGHQRARINGMLLTTGREHQTAHNNVLVPKAVSPGFERKEVHLQRHAHYMCTYLQA